MNPRALRIALKFLATVIAIVAGSVFAIVAAIRGPLWIFPALIIAALGALTVLVYRIESRNERSERDRAAS